MNTAACSDAQESLEVSQLSKTWATSNSLPPLKVSRSVAQAKATYAKDPPSPLVDDLDKYRQQDNRFTPAFPVYRHIEGNWYLYFEAD